MTGTTLPALVQHFFTARLCTQMQASQHTIASYRDTFRLLLRFASTELSKPPTKLTVENLDADLIGRFLAHIEMARSNGARSRNTRLAAIRSFFRHVALYEPALLLHCQKILAMPGKRFDRRAVAFLDNGEMEALLSAPDRSTWTGRRDHAMLVLALQTGLRASEIIGLDVRDIVPGVGAHVRCFGKGRKERCTPLRHETVKVLTAWLREREGSSDQPLFPTISGRRFREAQMSDAREQADHSPCSATQHRHGFAATWGRSICYRALAGSRKHSDHADIHTCGYADKRASAGKVDRVKRQISPIPTR
jgi:integrase/recombinase XerD